MTQTPARSNPIGWETVLCVSNHQVSSRVGEEVAILELDQGVYFGLNATGAYVWELLKTPIAVKDLHGALLAEFDVEAGAAREDLLNLVARLREAGLIEIRDADAG